MKHLYSGCVVGLASVLAACGGTSPAGGTFTPDGGGGGVDASSGTPPIDSGIVTPVGGDGGVISPTTHDAGGDAAHVLTGDGGVVEKSIIYAHTDSTLYSLDPTTNTVTQVGTFAGMSDASIDSVITDLAVNADGGVYVNTESVVYYAPLPPTGGTIQLQKLVTIGSSSDAGSVRFYALGFAPAGLLGSGETLVAGDGTGELWTIDPSSGAAQDVGNFGQDPNNSSNNLALSGDIVFYTDYTTAGAGAVHGLVTIRSCVKGKTTCSKSSDYLAAIDISALQSNYTGHTTTASLLGGIYGAPVGADGGATGTGTGTGYGEVFGLGAWGGTVYGFTRAFTTDAGSEPPTLISIDTTTGKGAVVTSSGFGFTTGGWSGAGVTTSVTIVIPPPPPPPGQPPQ